MSLKKTLARLLIFVVLEVGALAGVPMSPEQIEKIMNVMNRTKIERRITTERESC